MLLDLHTGSGLYSVRMFRKVIRCQCLPDLQPMVLPPSTLHIPQGLSALSSLCHCTEQIYLD